MVLVQYTLDIGKNESLDVFNNVTHMAFGDDNTVSNATQTELVNELLRIHLESSVKNLSSNQYEFIGRVPITNLNSETIFEIGLFNAASGGDMATRLVLNTGLTKDDDEELVFKIVIKINVNNK